MLAHSSQKIGPAFKPTMATNAASPIDLMNRIAASGNLPNQGRTETASTRRHTGEESSHAGAQGNLEPSDRECDYRAQQHSNENGDSQNREIALLGRPYDRAHHRGQLLNRRLRTRYLQRVSPFDDCSAPNRQRLISADYPAEKNAVRLVQVVRNVLKCSPGNPLIRDIQIERGNGDLEQF